MPPLDASSSAVVRVGGTSAGLGYGGDGLGEEHETDAIRVGAVAAVGWARGRVFEGLWHSPVDRLRGFGGAVSGCWSSLHVLHLSMGLWSDVWQHP